MKSPEYIVVINDWFSYKSSNGSPEISVREAMERFSQMKMEMHNEFIMADEEGKKMFDHATMNEPISTVRVVDMTFPYEKLNDK